MLLPIVACSDPEPPAGPTVVSRVERKEIPLSLQPSIDIVLVVDNSPQAAPHRASFVAAARSLGAVLETLPGGVPDLHVGIVTTDLGSRGAGDESATAHGDCSADGDAGVMISTASTTAFNYLVDVRRGDGVRELNYDGSLGDALAQTVSALPTGCSFPRPFEAIRRSIANPSNPGFLRPTADLAVFVLAASDDCSFTHQQFLDGADAYKCIEHPELLVPPSDLVSFLERSKSDPSKVIVGGAFGPATPLVDDPQTRTVQPSCTIDQRSARPGVRLHALVEQFPNRSSEVSVCDDDLSRTFELLGQTFREPLGIPCFESTPVELDGKHECITSLRPEGFEEQLIPECTDRASSTCFRIFDEPAACAFGSGKTIEIVDRHQTDVPTMEVVECAVE